MYRITRVPGDCSCPTDALLSEADGPVGVDYNAAHGDGGMPIIYDSAGRGDRCARQRAPTRFSVGVTN